MFKVEHAHFHHAFQSNVENPSVCALPFLPTASFSSFNFCLLQLIVQFISSIPFIPCTAGLRPYGVPGVGGDGAHSLSIRLFQNWKLDETAKG